MEYLQNNPAAPDHHSGIKRLSASAAQGNVQAEFLLGYLDEDNAVLIAESSKSQRRSTPVTAAFALLENH